jgi:hypothetical protein
MNISFSRSRAVSFTGTIDSPNKIQPLIEEKIRSKSFKQFMMYENLQKKYEGSSEKPRHNTVDRGPSMDFIANDSSFLTEAIDYQSKPKQKTL